MPLHSRWQSKVPRGALIDWSRPLARGLLGFYALNEAAGPTLVDAAGGLNLATVNYGSSSPWSSGTVGAALGSNLAGAGANAIVPSALQAPFPLTIAAGFRFAASPSASGVPILGLFHDTSTSTRLLSIEANGGPTLDYVYNLGGGNVFSTTFGVPAGVDYVVAASVQSGSQALYIGGAPAAGAGGTGTGSAAWGATSLLTIGPTPSFSASRTLNAVVYWAAWWSRYLGADEHAAIGAAGPSAIFGLIFGSARPYWLMKGAAAAARGPWPWFTDAAHSGGFAELGL